MCRAALRPPTGAPNVLIILIDDVDRLQPTEMLAVLKLCRLSARVKNTVFVLSLDPTIVSTLIQHAGADPEYLEKIVQKPIPLPPAEQAAIDRYLLFSDPPQYGYSPARRSAIDVLLDAMDIGVLPKVLLTGRSLESLPPGSRPGSASRAPSGAPGCCSPRSSR